MHLARLAALEQAAVVEEDVHELPEHVVERLHQLLADRGVGSGRLELPLGAGGLEGQRQAAALAGDRERRRGLALVLAGPEGDHDVAGLGGQLDLRAERAALGGERQRGQRPLAHDHRMHELHRHVTGVRARGGRAAQGQQPPAAREALGHPVAELREPLALRLEEALVRLRPLGKRPVEHVAAEGVRHAGALAAASGAPIRVSQSRH